MNEHDIDIIDEKVDNNTAEKDQQSTETNKEDMTYFDWTIAIALIIFVVYLLICILNAGLWNLIIKILVSLTFAGCYKVAEESGHGFAQFFFGLCFLLSILRIVFLILGKNGLLILIGYCILTAIACKIASNADKKRIKKINDVQ